MHRVELLSPAGSMQAFYGALNAGADAVYLAGRDYGARAYADNFTEEELRGVLRLAHLFNVSVYLTANTLTREKELPALTSLVRELYAEGLDGVIVQDLGTAVALRSACPGLKLHASTQMNVTGAGAVRFLQRLGFTRVIPARELSLGELRLLKDTGIEVETFVHGAMCYSYSGRCLMSGFLGGRSGNRGRCAGTCRLPYEILDASGRAVKGNFTGRRAAGGDEAGHTGAEYYPLSMRDLNVLSLLPELIDAGIDSLKIEGRMKAPEYAAGVTAVYRRYIDRFYQWDAAGRPGRWKIPEEDRRLLAHLYQRSGVSTGYYHTRNGRRLLTIDRPGYDSGDARRLEQIRTRYLTRRPARNVTGRAVIRSGERAMLEVALTGTTSASRDLSEALSENPAVYTAYGETVQAALSRPLDAAAIRAQLCRTGDTPFVMTELSIDTDGASFLTVSALNRLRRDALNGLWERVLRAYRPPEDAPRRDRMDVLIAGEDRIRNKVREEDSAVPCLIAMVQTPEQAGAVLGAGITALILDGALRDDPSRIPDTAAETGKRLRIYAALPQILRAPEEAWLEEYFATYRHFFYGFVTRNLEEVAFLREREYDKTVIADSSVYCWNRSAFDVLAPFCERIILPLELDRREMSAVFGDRLSRMILPVYGRAPLMVSAGCIRKTAGRCGSGGGYWFLRDRKGAVLPVQTDCTHCLNVIYNSVPTSLEGLVRNNGDPLARSVCGWLLSFTDESGRETARIAAQYVSAAAGEGSPRDPERVFTYGHYRKGVT